MTHIHGVGDYDKPDELISASIDGDDLVIRLPLDLLIWTQKQREDSMTVVDKAAMAKWLEENILEFGGNGDTGSTAFEDLVDECFIEALESAEYWIVGWWENEDEQ
jgi:hypothetical protein